MPDSPLAFATRFNDAIGMPKITFDEESQISVALSRIATRASQATSGRGIAYDRRLVGAARCFTVAICNARGTLLSFVAASDACLMSTTCCRQARFGDIVGPSCGSVTGTDRSGVSALHRE
jgi:hypothetical protein